MNQLVSRTSHDHPAIARRQHHPKRTVLTDICASVDISVLHKVSVAGLLEAGASVEVHICICMSLLYPIFVKTDAQDQGAMSIASARKMPSSTLKHGKVAGQLYVDSSD
jgi:hypothetical protein